MLSNFLETFIVYDEDILVGMARLIGDKGIGKLIEKDIEKYILENI